MEARDLLTQWWRLALVAALIVVALGFRMTRESLGLPPNLELVTATSFAAMLVLRHPVALAVPLIITVGSDVFMGNTAIALFTWSAWLVIGVAAVASRRLATRHRFWTALGFGVGSSVWFFLWTNAGVWFFARGVYYPAGLDGLMASYVAGLPFFRTMLLGNLVLVPAYAGGVWLVERLAQRRSPVLGRAIATS